MDDVEITHHFVGDEYAKVFSIKAGCLIGQHSHKFDHASALLAGTAKVFVDGEEMTFKAPVLLTIERDKQHVISAVTDVLWACLWANPDQLTDPEKFDETVIP